MLIKLLRKKRTLKKRLSPELILASFKLYLCSKALPNTHHS
jgi:hypothetical protein